MKNAHNIRQLSSLSQVFLKEIWPCELVAKTIHEWSGQNVLEVGPGSGALTRALCDAGHTPTVVEKDARFASLIRKQFPKVQVVEEDILRFDFAPWQSGRSRTIIVGNIPYAISSPLLLRTLEWLPFTEGMMFLVQKEFAQRVCASPCTKDYGSLSVYTQLRAQVTLGEMVSKNCFTPVPKVDSAFIILRPLTEPYPREILERVEPIARATFQLRRKKLSNSLKPFLKLELPPGPLDLNRRPETLTIDEFIELATWLKR